MRRYAKSWWKLLALIPMMGVYSTTTCQADALRRTAEALDERADDIDRDDDELGELLSDIVEDW